MRRRRFSEEGLHGDLHEFARRHRLDAYELTDRELAELVEVWRWALWRARTRPTPTDHDILEAARDLRRRLARDHNLDVEYNTFYLLKDEAEPLLHLRALWAGWAALLYFLHPRALLRLPVTWWRAWRYARTAPVPENTAGLVYPRAALRSLRLRPPRLLRRKYWHPIGSATLDERKRTEEWD